MQEAVKRFVESRIDAARVDAQNGIKDPAHGLTLIDMPTGSGKTYNTISLLESYIRGGCFQDVEHVFYLTPLNKNVKDTYEDLEKRFKGEDKHLFEENCLWIQSNAQCVIDHLNEVASKMFPSIKRKDSYKNLISQIDYLHSLDTNSPVQGSVLSNVKAGIEDEIRQKLEPKFREDIKNEVSKLGKNQKARLAVITREYPWLLKIYPAILTDFRKVYFMSVDKFCAANDTIIGKSYRFVNDIHTREALIFVDEIDTSKEYILRSQIKACVQRKIDLIRLFSTMTDSLASEKKFPTEMFEGSSSDDPKKNSKYAFQRMKEVLLQRREEFHLDYSFKLEKDKSEDRNFLFEDYSIHTISSTSKNNQVYIETNEEKNQNIIKVTPFKSKANDRFYKMIYGMNGALSFVTKSIVHISRNYLLYYNTAKKGREGDQMEPEEAVSTILTPFQLDDGLHKALQKMAVDDYAFPYVKTKQSIIDADFYMEGFRYFDFIDDLSHDTTTSISMCLLNETPEKFLYNLCSRAMVVGVSATASIETVTGNYNLKYLQRRLGDAFYELPYADASRIRSKIQKQQDGQEYKIDVTTVKTSSERDEELAKEIFSAPDHIDVLGNILAQDSKDYKKKRCAKILKTIKSFLLNPNSKAMLVLTNNNLRNTGEAFSKDRISKLIKLIQAEIGDRGQVEIHALYGNTFEKEKEAYRREIKEGKRVILFSSYPSAGTGQNLQYSIVGGADEKSEIQQDIDSIYLERPTNILVNTSANYPSDDAQGLTEEDLVKAVYQAESLQNIGDVPPQKALDMIKKAFKVFMKGETKSIYNGSSHLNEYKTNSVNNHAIKILEQGIGRICRTRDSKKNDVNIYVDEDIYLNINFDSVRNKPKNREFQEFISKGENVELVGNNLQRGQNVADGRSARLNRKLNALMSKTKIRWSKEEMESWKAIREIVLKHPTWTVKEANEQNVDSLYADYVGHKLSDVLYYSRDLDTDRIETSFGKTKKCSLEVSEAASKLDAFCSIPAVREYFKQHGYITEWKKDECVLNPVAFINLYKGALGEAAGLALLSKLGIPIQEITEVEKFEKFDYFDGEDIYFDFKNWSDNNSQSNSENLKHIEDKLQRVQGKKVFIINAVARDGFKIHDNGTVCQIPSLILDKDGKYVLDTRMLKEIRTRYREAKNNGHNQ